MSDLERRRQILEEERLRAALRSRNKVVGLLLTFFFPVFGFLYSTNYVWALIALLVDVVNFLLVFALGLGIVAGLLWRLLALVIANHGIDRHRSRTLGGLERELDTLERREARPNVVAIEGPCPPKILPRNY